MQKHNGFIKFRVALGCIIIIPMYLDSRRYIRVIIMHLSASQCISMHPNASQCILMHLLAGARNGRKTVDPGNAYNRPTL